MDSCYLSVTWRNAMPTLSIWHGDSTRPIANFAMETPHSPIESNALDMAPDKAQRIKLVAGSRCEPAYE